MKIKKTIYEETLKQLQVLQNRKCFNFSLGNKDYSHNFLSKNPKPAVISSVELPKPELVIFFLGKLIGIFDTLVKNIDKIEEKNFELLYAYFNLILNEIDFLSLLRNVKGHIKNEKYRKDILDGFQMIKLNLKSESLTFPENTKLQNIKPINDTLKMFEILDDFIGDFSDYEMPKIQKTDMFLDQETGDFNIFNLQGNISIVTREYKLLQLLINRYPNNTKYLEIIKLHIKNGKDIEFLKVPKSEIVFPMVRDLKTMINKATNNKETGKIIKNIRGIGYKLVRPKSS